MSLIQHGSWLAMPLLLLGASVLAAGEPTAPRTLRLDYYHTGTATEEYFSLDRLVVEPLPWPGNPARPIDDTHSGKYLFEVHEAASDKLLFSRGFASIYGEWETTAEATRMHRTFHESLRFPLADPAATLRVVLKKRDAANAFRQVWEIEIDPKNPFVDTAHPPKMEVLEFQRRGESSAKVDLLLLGDGYTASERDKFERDAQRMIEILFATSPFKERRDDWNVWGICPPAAASGISRPSTGIHRRTPVGATYDAFGSERYVLTFENRTWRDIAAWAPYEFVQILVNNATYGGGGIFGLYGTVAVDNDWASYIFVHEFGHHFAGLADEYYTSPVAYEPPAQIVEPWEPNVTATIDPEQLKWGDLLTAGVEIPTRWPKEPFEVHAREIRKRRQRIRAERRPEAEMSALFSEQQAFESELLGSAPHADKVGVFEGANYAPRGFYRSQIDCIMFTRDQVPFCAACRRAIERMIDLYTSGE